MSDERKISVSAGAIRCVLPFRGIDEGRMYLTDVFIDPHHDKGVYVVATNGATMAIYYDESGSSNKPWRVSVSPDFERSIKNKKTETVHFDDEFGWVSQRFESTNEFDSPLPADVLYRIEKQSKFVEWSSVLVEVAPDVGDTMLAHAEYIRKAADAFSGANSVTIFPAKNQPIIFRGKGWDWKKGIGYDRLLVLVMPIWADEDTEMLWNDRLPEWLP